MQPFHTGKQITLQDNEVGSVVEIVAVTYDYFQILLKLAEMYWIFVGQF